MRHDVRNVEIGVRSTALAQDLAPLFARSQRGDKQVLLVPRLDDKGHPTGNREERRMAKRILRRRVRGAA